MAKNIRVVRKTYELNAMISEKINEKNSLIWFNLTQTPVSSG